VALRFSADVAGVDFSGDPSAGRFKDFVPVLSKARGAGFKVAVHFAEVDEEADALDSLRFGPERLGHGTFMVKGGGGLL
jgi:adenosine deaminase